MKPSDPIPTAVLIYGCVDAITEAKIYISRERRIRAEGPTFY